MKTPSRSVKEMCFFTLNPPDTPENHASGETGQGMVEYGLIVGLVAILVIAVFVVLGPTLRDMLQEPVAGDEQADRAAAVSSAVYQ